MQHLADLAWEHYDHAVANADGQVVKPSMPILYFGDGDAYRRSTLKILTVGLNPSRREFPVGDPWCRFPSGARGTAYLDSLDAYFRTDPYAGWFASFEPLLVGMGASYYGGESVALHTDICSPVATDPTWSHLGAAQLSVGDGFDLWRELVETLAPDVIVASVARRHLLRLGAGNPDQWPSIHTIERRNRYQVRMHEARVGGHRVPVVFGRAAQKPFGTVASGDRPAIGAAIMRALDAR